MTCEECKALLLELVDGDLPPTQATEVRAAAAECPECQTELHRLEQGLTLTAALPLVAVPPQLSQRIMAVARTQAAEAQASAIPATSRVSSQNLLRGWLNFVERFAAGPQLGMATLMLLIVAGTFWAVPSLERAPEAAGGSVVTQDGNAEAVASDMALEPADRLELAVDMRHGRIRTKEEQRSLGRRRAASPPVASAPPAAPALVQTSDDVEEEVPAEASGSPTPAAVKSAPSAFQRFTGAPPPAETTRPARGAPGVAAEASAVSQLEATPAAPPPDPVIRKKSKRRKSTAVLKSPYSDAKQAPRRVRALQSPHAMLLTAREAQKSGDCASAVTLYERVILAAPSSDDATAAMREAIQCYTKLGRLRRARELRADLAERSPAQPPSAKPTSAEQPAAADSSLE